MLQNRYYTPGIPMGWFQVEYTDQLKVGDVKPLKYFGKDLVLYRTESGEAVMLDAHCPHLGAHLGHGGKVKGENIECPFHAWQFATDGNVAAVPYAQRLPRKACIPKWTIKEVGGLVMTWYHPEGGAPKWDIPDEIPEWGNAAGERNDKWTDYEIREWTIRTTNQEMAENSVDSAHFHYVHGATNMPQSEAEVRDHVLRVFSNTGMETPRGPVPGSVESLAYGFGMALVRFKGIVETLNVACTTPIDEDNVHVRFAFAVNKSAGANVAKGVGMAFVKEVSRQLGQDIPIWENKIQHEQPLLCDGDGPIGMFRRWCQQFYARPQEAAAAE